MRFVVPRHPPESKPLGTWIALGSPYHLAIFGMTLVAAPQMLHLDNSGDPACEPAARAHVLRADYIRSVLRTIIGSSPHRWPSR